MCEHPICQCGHPCADHLSGYTCQVRGCACLEYKPDLEKMIAGSFLRRVPDIIAERNCSMDEAIQIAYDQEELFLIQLASPGTRRPKWAQSAFDVMCEEVYKRIRT